jgi:alanine dehydrogenase
MSVIAGKLSIQCGASSLQAGNGGRGILLGGTVGVRPARVVVIGAGAAGSNAAKVALGMGAEVTVLDVNPMRLLPFSERTYRARTLYSSPAAIQREVSEADLVIGSVLIPGALAPKLITRQILSTMKRGSVIVDICIDQGGFAESSRPTTIAEPTFVDSGVVHYCVTNMPALVPRTSTEALTSASLPWVKIIADRGVVGALKSSQPVRHSLTSFRGNLTNSVIGEAVGLQSIANGELSELLG